MEPPVDPRSDDWQTLVVVLSTTADISRDAAYSFLWHRMDEDTRQIVCLLADISSEAAWCRWRQMQTVERVALRAALQTMIVDHWRIEQQRFSQPPQEDA